MASSSSEGLCSMMQYSMLYYVSFQEDRDITSKTNTKGAKTTTRPNINQHWKHWSAGKQALIIKLCIQTSKRKKTCLAH